MRITLKQWLELRKLAETAKEAQSNLVTHLLCQALDHPANSPERTLLMRYANEADEADLPGPYLFTPQSDWLGGDSDNPRNHGLREPVCVPGLRRSFTRKEIATVQGRCHGPCDWSYSI